MPLPLTGEQFQSVVRAGVLAPSADNRHPFNFECVGDAIRIRGDADFLKASYHRRILLRVSAGAIVQNMILEAGTLGFGVRTRWFPDPGDPTFVARLDLEDGGEAETQLAGAIPFRHTNRRLLFRGPGLGREQREALERDVAIVAGARLVWLDGVPVRNKALRLIRLSEAERFRNRSMHEELFSSVRFGVGWHRVSDEGLAPGALGVERPLRPIFATLRHWSLMRLLNLVGGHHFMGVRAGDLPCRFAPHLAVVVTDLEVEPGALAVGQAFERLWLRAHALGLALQPLAASALFALQGYEDVPTELRYQLQRGWADIVGDARPLIVFRLGRASAPAVGSGRRPLETYLA